FERADAERVEGDHADALAAARFGSERELRERRRLPRPGRSDERDHARAPAAVAAGQEPERDAFETGAERVERRLGRRDDLDVRRAVGPDRPGPEQDGILAERRADLRERARQVAATEGLTQHRAAPRSLRTVGSRVPAARPARGPARPA